MINVLYIPHRGLERKHEGIRWEKGVRWGSDFMLENVQKFVSSEYRIIPFYSIPTGNLEEIDIIHIHNIPTITLKRRFLRTPFFRLKNILKMENRPKIIGGIRGNVGLKKARNYLKYFDAIHVSNKTLKKSIKKLHPKVYLLYPGEDLTLFKPMLHLRPEFLLLGWAGDKNKKMKNFHLLHKLGYPYKTATKENYIPHSEMPLFYNSVNVYVYFSSHEGCNRTIIEAAACALPIISTDAGAVRDIIESEWIVETNPKDEEKTIKEFIKRLKILENNKSLRNGIGMRNRNRVNRWDWKKIVKEHEEIWNDILRYK